MKADELKEQIRNRGDNVQVLADTAAADPKLIPVLLELILVPQAAQKYKSFKVISLISQQKPVVLYPHFDTFAQLLDSSLNIFKWHAIDILAYLVAVDSEARFPPLFNKYYGFLNEGSLITAGHVVERSPVIVKARPQWEPRITRELLRAEIIPLPTEECRNILGGKVLLSFTQYIQQSQLKAEMLEYARRLTSSTRPATGKKAVDFIRKFA